LYSKSHAGVYLRGELRGLEHLLLKNYEKRKNRILSTPAKKNRGYAPGMEMSYSPNYF